MRCSTTHISPTSPRHQAHLYRAAPSMNALCATTSSASIVQGKKLALKALTSRAELKRAVYHQSNANALRNGNMGGAVVVNHQSNASGLRLRSRNMGGAVVVRASFGEGGEGGDVPESATMDYQGALSLLGLTESATSEEMVRAKNKMLKQFQKEEEKLQTVSHATPTGPLLRARVMSKV